MTEPRRWRRRLTLTVVSLTIGILAAEALLRAALFGPVAIARLRRADLYAQADEDLYWKLRYLWSDPAERLGEATSPDPQLGWLSAPVAPGSYAHRDDDPDGGRPILLFGDSFAHCVVPPERCFEGIHRARGPADHQLLNFGVGGYGLDQTYLLMREVVGRYAGRDPIVVFSLYLDGDLDRTLLRVRDWPKPKLAPTRDGLKLETPPAANFDELLEEQPLSVRSYLWRLVVYGSPVLPRSWARQLRHEGPKKLDKRRLGRALLEEAHAFLEGAGIEHFVFVFHERSSLGGPETWTWHELFLRKVLAESEIPWVDTRPELTAAAREDELPLERFYIPAPRTGAGHHNYLGNVAAYEALLRGVRGEYDPY